MSTSSFGSSNRALVATFALLLGLSATASVAESRDGREPKWQIDLSSGGQLFSRNDDEVFLVREQDGWRLFASSSRRSEPGVVTWSDLGAGLSIESARGWVGSIGLRGRELTAVEGTLDAGAQAFVALDRGRWSLQAGSGFGDDVGSFARVGVELGKAWLAAAVAEDALRHEIAAPEEALQPLDRLRFFQLLDSRGDGSLRDRTPFTGAELGMGWVGERQHFQLEVRSGDERTAGGREVDHRGMQFEHRWSGDHWRSRTDLAIDDIASVLYAARFAHATSWSHRLFDAELAAFLDGEATELGNLVDTAAHYGGATRFRFGGAGLRMGPFFVFERDREVSMDVVQAGVSARWRGRELLLGWVAKTVGRPRFEEKANGVMAAAGLGLEDLLPWEADVAGARVELSVGWEEDTTNVDGGAWGSLRLSRSF